jgi:hypothetical protein
MTRLEFIEQYKNKINRILPEFRQAHIVNDSQIGSLFLKEWVYYDIDKCIKIIDITKEARAYIYNLKIGDKIKIYSYGNEPEVEIIKITYKRILDKKGNKIISKFTTKEILNSNREYINKSIVKDIIYRGSAYREIFDSYLHCSGIFLNFNGYDTEQADKIIARYEGVNNGN